MARPALNPSAIAPQTRGWDALVDDNFTEVKATLTQNPFPMPLVYKTTTYTGAIQLSTLAASDYVYCYAHLTDAATVATNGRLIYSDGTNWKYTKSDTTV